MNKIPDCQYDYGYEEPTALVMGICDDCDGNVVEGEEYYKVDEHTICADCIDTYKFTAECT